MCSVTFLKPSTGIPVPAPVSNKKVPFRLLYLKNLCIPAGTNSYSGPWTTLRLTGSHRRRRLIVDLGNLNVITSRIIALSELGRVRNVGLFKV